MLENLAWRHQLGYTVAFKADAASQAKTTPTDIWRARTFDWVLGNTDRHNGNWMVAPYGKLALIDNGYIFRGDMYTYMGHPPTPLPASIVHAWTDAAPRIKQRLTTRGINAADISTVMGQIDRLKGGRDPMSPTAIIYETGPTGEQTITGRIRLVAGVLVAEPDTAAARFILGRPLLSWSAI